MEHGEQIWKRLSAWRWRLLLVYLCLLAVSFVVRSRQPREVAAPNVQLRTVPAIQREQPTQRSVRVAYGEFLPESNPSAPVVVLLHGSPGNHRDFQKFAPALAKHYRVIVPDLPGFGSSSHSIPDYSTRAHARYVLELLDQLHIERAHFIGFSMGGGVVLNIADIAPQRVQSIVMLSAIGVQELELLGNYHINHSLHGLQLGFLQLLLEGVPHMGWLDRSMLDVSYARNFYDTDQRPLRAILAKYEGPMLIVHGERDILVPVEAAREHYRLVPQSELRIFSDESHFYVFGHPEQAAASSLDFLDRVDKGQARLKTTADPQRVAQAAAPFNPAAAIPRAMGPTALVLFTLLALATLISEDLTCIWAGVMAAQGRISFVFAAIACLAGIFIGDLLLYLAGRVLGRAALRRAPLRWFVREEDVARGSLWFQRRGMWAILFSRFLPGTRLPTYVAAGLLDTGFWRFSFYFLIAATLWTPLLVGLSMWVGGQVIESALLAPHSWLLKVLLSGVLSFIAIRLVTRLASFRGRRLLLGRWRRLTQWEFWPPWLFYPPIILYVGYLAIKNRSLTLFTCANPAIEAGGFIGESKSAILQGLARGPEAPQFIARLALLQRSLGYQSRLELAHKFMNKHGFSFPVVLKPDVGERGLGVAVVRSDQHLTDYLLRSQGTDVIIQEHIAGLEFGVFYYRYPESGCGHIFSVTRKLFPSVVGDGKATLEELILKDDRAVSMARAYFAAQRDHLWDIPARGVSVQLIEIGTHCRGSVFLDGSEVATKALNAAIERLARGFEGFYFGRFDIRTPSLADFQAGRNFKVVELNGVTSEATHIYDPKIQLPTAYRILADQWRIAFEIGAQNRKNGTQKAPLRVLLRLLVKKCLKKTERSGEDARPIRTEAERSSQVASEA